MKTGLTVTRQFTLEDQLRFAELSGDFNPMHVDRVAARRTIYGDVVVHGVHSLLWALEGLIDVPTSLAHLKADFKKQIRLGDKISCTATANDGGKYSLVLEIAGEVVARIAVSFSKAPIFKVALAQDAKPSACRDLNFEQMAAASGSLSLFVNETVLGISFPGLARKLPIWQVAEVLATTRLVGMECPGLHSIFSSLDLHFHEEASDEAELKYQVTRSDRRFSMVWIGIKAPGMNGTLTTFARPRPSAQPELKEISRFVAPKEFAGQRALVVGGSRGLGEITAKIIAAGGGDVCVTYHRGKEDAERVANKIAANGVKSEIVIWDVSDPSEQLSLSWKPTHLYYFATPLISLEKNSAFSTKKFQQYCQFYVSGFARVVELLLRQSSERLTVFYPSTIFLEQYQEHAAEYCAAKGAGETLCRQLEKQYPQVRIFCPRLPRMKTDQTSSLIPISAAEPLDVMLEAIRKMNSSK